MVVSDKNNGLSALPAFVDLNDAGVVLEMSRERPPPLAIGDKLREERTNDD